MELLLLGHVGATLFMVGLIWFVQVVHYPLFGHVGGEGFVLLAVVWLSTALLQVPRHTTLGSGFDAAAHRFLVASNWLRTVCWSAHGLLVLWMVARSMG